MKRRYAASAAVGVGASALALSFSAGTAYAAPVNSAAFVDQVNGQVNPAREAAAKTAKAYQDRLQRQPAGGSVPKTGPG
uniref:hypothetical protein n=1 Tax=Amycolatopsis sp. cmx-11-12 TaxID=2785795 RepID=UPI0039185C78